MDVRSGECSDPCNKCVCISHINMDAKSSQDNYLQTSEQTLAGGLLIDVNPRISENINASQLNELSNNTFNQLTINLNKDLESEAGIIYIGFSGKGDKTNPEKLIEWFSPEFLNHNKVYAIKEEEAFLLKIYTRVREVANKVMRKKGGRKSTLMGQEVYGDIIIACGRCGYHSNEGSNVRRHLRKSVCVRDRGYSRKELDGMNRTERQKFIRRIASAKFRAKKKIEDEHGKETCSTEVANTEFNMMEFTDQNSSPSDHKQLHDSGNNLRNLNDSTSNKCNRDNTLHYGEAPYSNNKLCVKVRKKPCVAKVLTLGPFIANEPVRKLSFDVYTVSENNVRVAWKPPVCHKAVEGACQIVFKGARMKRRCLDLPLPLILTYRKLDCKIHHCNFTLFHPHARRTYKEDPKAFTSVTVRMYGDTAMTQDFYHYFVSLLSVMKMKSSQTARHLTSVWETILSERLQTNSVPEEYRKIITLSKQTVKSMWNSIEEESGKKSPAQSSKSSSKRKKCVTFIDGVTASHSLQPSEQSITHKNTQDLTYGSTTLSAPEPLHSHPLVQSQQQQQVPTHPPLEYDQQQHCIKRFPHVLPKLPAEVSVPSHAVPLPHPSHSHTMLQGHLHPAPPPPHWLGQPHPPHQYPPPVAYPIPPHHHEDYYSVQASFMTQYTPAVIGSSP